MNEKDNFGFWVAYLKAISIFFALMGAMWAVIGNFDPFGFYESYFAQAFWQSDTLPQDAKRTFNFILGPFGATSMGYFILQYFIAANAYAKREKWAYRAVIVAFLAWFVLDTSMSIRHGAYFNVLIANVSALFAMLPVFFTKKYFEVES